MYRELKYASTAHELQTQLDTEILRSVHSVLALRLLKIAYRVEDDDNSGVIAVHIIWSVMHRIVYSLKRCQHVS